MTEGTTWVGLDVHQEQSVAAMIGDVGSKVQEFRVAGDNRGVSKLVRQLQRLQEQATVESAEEAGPTGYTLQRRLKSERIGCTVVAPSLAPVKPGDRIKTDRRDARKLAEHLRAGLLTATSAPSEEQEAERERGEEALVRERPEDSRTAIPRPPPPRRF